MEKNKYDIMRDVDIAIEPLFGLDTIIDVLIEDFALDEETLSEGQQFDLIHRYDMIYDVLAHVRNAIQSVNMNMSAFTNGDYFEEKEGTIDG